MKLLLTILLSSSVFFISFSQQIYIPDDAFEAYLESNAMHNGQPNDNYVSADIVSRVTNLNIANQSISDLTGLEYFLELETLICPNNQLKTIDVSKNTKLALLDCSNNQLTSLDVSSNTALANLDCSNNQLTNLDLSKNPELKTLDCSSNELNFLNLKNGNNENISSLNIKYNPSLSLIKVSSIELMILNFPLQKKTSTKYIESLDSNLYTHIPDPNFEHALIDAGYDTDGINGRISTVDIEHIAVLHLGRKDISDLTGIQAFKNLQQLYCNDNNLEKLDISKNIELRRIDCEENKLEFLDLSKNINLETIYAFNNQLKSVNIKNNNNHNLRIFNVDDNPSLRCIQVDYPLSFMSNNEDAYYSEDCAIVLSSHFNKITKPSFINIGIENNQVKLDPSIDRVEFFDFLGNPIDDKKSRGIYIVKITKTDGSIFTKKISVF